MTTALSLLAGASAMIAVLTTFSAEARADGSKQGAPTAQVLADQSKPAPKAGPAPAAAPASKAAPAKAHAKPHATANAKPKAQPHPKAKAKPKSKTRPQAKPAKAPMKPAKPAATARA
jgi:hypothetical protein